MSHVKTDRSATKKRAPHGEGHRTRPAAPRTRSRTPAVQPPTRAAAARAPAITMPVQPKMKVSRPGDPMEVQADEVASRVTSGQTPAPPEVSKSADTAGAQRQSTDEDQVQRQADEESVQRQADDESDVQTKADDDSEMVQRQAGEEGDVQRQADEESEVQRQADDESDVQTKADDDSEAVQRQADEERDVQRQADDESDVQRQADEEGEVRRQADEEGEVQRQADDDSEVQTKADDDSDVQRQADEESEVQRQADEEGEVQRLADDESDVQTKAADDRGDAEVQPLGPGGGGAPRVTPRTAATIRNPRPGSKLPAPVRASIEPHLGANLGGVRVHTDPESGKAAASLGARAFTVGSDIFLGGSESAHDMPLMAHEATHVVQQGAAGHATHAARTPAEIQLLPDFITDRIAGYARHIPGYTLFTVIIGFNPLTGRDVDRNAINLIEGLMGLVPFGTYIFDQLTELGVITAAFEFVEQQLATYDLSLERLERVIEDAWDDMDFIRLDPFDYNIGVLKRHVGGLITDVENFAGSVVDRLMELIKEALIGVADDLLAENKAWALIKKVLHYDPLRNEEVDAPTVEILEDFLLLIGKETELEQMKARDTLQDTADWLDTQLDTFLGLLTELGGLFTAAWEALQPANLANLGTNLESIVTRAGAFLQRVWDFATTVAVEVLALIKDALLAWLSDFAHEVPGFHLLTVILRRNPFTGEVVPRSAVNLIRGFITLIPGGNAIYEQLSETGVIGEAGARIEGAVADLGISWEFIVGIFTGIWEGLSIDDLIDPIGAFTRIRDQFGEPISRLFEFIKIVVIEIFKLILALMNFPTDILARIITNAIQAFEDIRRDPIGFLVNMLAAVKLGFSNFFDNFLTHLVDGLVEWLFGGLREAGIEPPADLSLGSILETVLEVLGLSMDRIWEKLAERFGQERVDQIRGAIDRLTGIWNFVRDVQERGITAVWEYIQSQISNLWNMVLEAATQWITEKIISRVTAKLLSMLDPTGVMAVVNSFIAFFNAVQSAIQYIREILEIVDSYVATLAAVAAGDIEPGAARMEGGLAAAIPVAIGFLANQVGLGNIGEKMQEIIEGVRGVVDQALDWLLDRLEEVVQGVLSAIGLGGGAEEEAGEAPVEGDEDVDATDHAAVGAAVTRQLQAVDGSGGYDATRTLLEARARDLEAHWSSRLEDGIGLTVNFTDPAADGADQDVDMRIVIAPNTTEVAATVETAGFPVDWGAPPTTRVVPISEGKGGAEARPLVARGSAIGHSTSNRLANNEILALNRSLAGQQKPWNWMGLHLVNHNLGGPNEGWNLWPGTRLANGNMLSNTEIGAKAAIGTLGASEAMWYRTVITDTWDYPSGAKTADFVKSGYTEWGILVPPYVGDAAIKPGTKQNKPFGSDDPNVQAAGVTQAVNLNSESRETIARVSGGTITEYRATQIIERRAHGTVGELRANLERAPALPADVIDRVVELIGNGTYRLG